MPGAELPEPTFESVLNRLDYLKRVMLKSLREVEKPPVLQRLPIRPHWEAIHREYEATSEEIRALSLRCAALHRKLWTTIESDTGIYEQMHWNEDEKFIEVSRFTEPDAAE